MNVTAKAKWKSVPMDAQLRARGFAEGLLGIEELSSYDLTKLKKSKESKNVVKIENSQVVGKKIKRKSENQENEKDGAEPQKKKKKTRQKRKPKVKKNKFVEKPNKVEKKVENSEKEVEKVQDENIEMEGWKNFAIPPKIIKALKELDFQEPTPIQKETLPAAISGTVFLIIRGPES